MARTYTHHWKDYELIDAGNEQKLERWGSVITIRPDRNAYFQPVLSEKEWENRAHFQFQEISKTKGNWIHLKPNTPTEWQIAYTKMVFNLKLTQFKHLGIFPEQRTNWDYISNKIKPNQRFLNLFGYTGGASLSACAVGADTYHCDSVRQINGWAKENMQSSGLKDIRWVLDDALKFAQREAKRGNKYNGISMDPPAFGWGAKKERWKIEDRFPDLMRAAKHLLSEDGFIIVNTYSPRLSQQRIKTTLNEIGFQQKINISKLSIKSTTGKVIEYGDLTLIS